MKKIAVSIIIAALACAGYYILQNKKKKNASYSFPKEHFLVIKTFKPTYNKRIILTLPCVGKVENESDVLVSSKYSGKVLWRKESGEKVKKGEIVAKIDNVFLKTKLQNVSNSIKEMEQKIASLSVILKNLKTSLQRTRELLKVKGASLEEYEMQENKIQKTKSILYSQKAKLASLKEKRKEILNELSYTSITSPISGIVAKTFVNIGDNVFPSKPILKISSFLLKMK